MIKRLAGVGLVRHEPYHGVSLTEAGTQAALEVIRHHRLLELYLMQALGLSWDEVHAEAERLEHHLSETLEARIDAALGHPTRDPHGDPIPRSDGSLTDTVSCSLAQCAVGDGFRLSRVMDQSPEFLRFLSSSGLPLGTVGEIVTNRPEAGIVTVNVGGRQTSLGKEAAQKLMVVRSLAVASSS